MCAVVGAQSAFCFGMDVAHDKDSPFDVAGRVLAKTLKAARLPERVRVQVRDPELVTALRRRADLAEVQFEVVERLDAVDFMLSHLERDLLPRRGDSPLGKPGVTVERLAAFAEGCAEFHAARPWRQLHDDDVIEVHAPEAPAGMRFASVLGAGGQVIGIGFYHDLKGYAQLAEADDPYEAVGKKPRWSFMFYGPDEVPVEEHDLWREHGLRVAADDSIPVLLRYHRTKSERPDGAALTFTEGLCRAIAATSEAEIDSGRWEKAVQTFDGPVTYRLTVPHLLESASAVPDKAGGVRPGAGLEAFGPAALERSMQQVLRMLQGSGATSVEEMNALLDAHVNGKAAVGAPPPANDKERALDLCYQAQGQHSRRELQLIREALRLDPDCAEAYVLLARRESDPAEAEKHYRRGVEAGRRSLGEAAFRDPDYPFWGTLESRPFMRALFGLGDVLEMQGRAEEAADVFADVLRLNPGDNQGARYRYVPLLIATGRLDAAREMIHSEEYRDDISALWDFAAALISFKQGRAAEAAQLLAKAAGRNPHVIPLLKDPEAGPPGMSGTWSPGAPSEAEMVVDLLGGAWRSDPEAMQWLRGAAGRDAQAAAKLKAKPKSKTRSTRPPKLKRKRGR
jgi:tetratricopeptide (TPR) repeat protein